MEIRELASKLKSAHVSRRVMMQTLGLVGGASAAGGAFAADPGASEITVDKARQAPIPVAVSDFDSEIGRRIQTVITDDLQSTELFTVTDGGKMPANKRPDFKELKARGMRVAIAGKASVHKDELRVEMRLWDVITGDQLAGVAYKTTQDNWRRIAHIIGDVVYEALLGEPGFFDTRVAYIAMTGPRSRQVTRLAIMDQDGANNHVLTDGKWMTMEPRFDPVRDQLAFLSYADNRPQVYLYDMQTGRQKLLGAFDGISYAPRFSPDGQSIILSVTTRNGGANIVLIDLATRAKRNLTTNSNVIDTSPCFSPDGSQIVFVSDRGGSQQLYVMPVQGGEARRISFGQGNYGSPVWSPRGDKIAFIHIANHQFSLGLMSPDGLGERILSSGFTVEGPTFSPNGRALIFCVQTRAGAGGRGFTSKLKSISINGTNERTLPTPTNAAYPAWSPYRRRL